MRNVIDNVEPRNIVQTQQVNGVRLFLAEDGHEDVVTANLLLTAGLHVKDSALQHALETECRLNLLTVVGRQSGRRLIDEFR